MASGEVRSAQASWSRGQGLPQGRTSQRRSGCAGWAAGVPSPSWESAGASPGRRDCRLLLRLWVEAGALWPLWVTVGEEECASASLRRRDTQGPPGVRGRAEPCLPPRLRPLSVLGCMLPPSVSPAELVSALCFRALPEGQCSGAELGKGRCPGGTAALRAPSPAHSEGELLRAPSFLLLCLCLFITAGVPARRYCILSTSRAPSLQGRGVDLWQMSLPGPGIGPSVHARAPGCPPAADPLKTSRACVELACPLGVAPVCGPRGYMYGAGLACKCGGVCKGRACDHVQTCMLCPRGLAVHSSRQGPEDSPGRGGHGTQLTHCPAALAFEKCRVPGPLAAGRPGDPSQL